jgi:hypothetical protein
MYFNDDIPHFSYILFCFLNIRIEDLLGGEVAVVLKEATPWGSDRTG